MIGVSYWHLFMGFSSIRTICRRLERSCKHQGGIGREFSGSGSFAAGGALAGTWSSAKLLKGLAEGRQGGERLQHGRLRGDLWNFPLVRVAPLSMLACDDAFVSADGPTGKFSSHYNTV